MERKAQLINQILQACVANGVNTTGELFFSLACATEQELEKICHELYIKPISDEKSSNSN